MELAPLKKEIHEKYLHAKLLDCTLRVSKSCGSKNIFMDMVTTKFLNLFTGKLKKKKTRELLLVCERNRRWQHSQIY